MINQFNFNGKLFSKKVMGTVLIVGAISCTNNQQEVTIDDELVHQGSNARIAIGLSNSGFESNWSGWDDVDPSAISGDANSGSKSAKISGSGGAFGQEVSISSNTDYELSAYVKGSWRISATVNGARKSRSGNASDWKKEIVSFNSGSGSSVTIKGEYNSGEGRFDDFELIALDESTPTNPPAEAEQLNPSGVAASANDGNGPSNTVDGNLGTRWSANGNGQWIRYDLGSVKNIDNVDIAWYKGDQRSSTFEILVGDATNALEVVHSGVSSGNSSNLETVNLSNASGRYVQIVGYGNTSNSWNSITEVEIFGTDGDGDGTDPTEPTDPVDPNPGGEYPYDVLGLQNWKLNAFSGSLNNPSYVDNIPNLETYNNTNWFYKDGSRVYFKCYAGYPTSSGSGNPRTELREMVADGSTEIYWDGRSGTNRMEWKVEVNQLPSSGKLCFGQIHGPSNTFDDVIRVQFEGDPNQSSGNVRLKIMGWVTEENDDGSGDFIDGNWALDQEMHLELIFENSNVVLYNLAGGGRDEIYRFNGVSSNSNYFKAGNYMQSMKGKSLNTNDYGLVSISYLKIKH